MPPVAAIPAAARKTLLEWIEHDDGHTTSPSLPGCTPKAVALHAQVCTPAGDHAGEPLQPPPGLQLAPLG